MSMKRRKLNKIKNVEIKANTSLFADSIIEDNECIGVKCGLSDVVDKKVEDAEKNAGTEVQRNEERGVVDKNEIRATTSPVTHDVLQNEMPIKDRDGENDGPMFERLVINDEYISKNDTMIDILSEKGEGASTGTGTNVSVFCAPLNEQHKKKKTPNKVINSGTMDAVAADPSDVHDYVQNGGAPLICRAVNEADRLDRSDRSIQTRSLIQSVRVTDGAFLCDQQERLAGPDDVTLKRGETSFSGENGILNTNEENNIQKQQSHVISTDRQSPVINEQDAFLRPISCIDDPAGADHTQKGESSAENLKEQTNKTLQLKEHMKKENDYVQENTYDDDGLITQCEASEVLLRLSEGGSDQGRSESARQSTSGECGAQEMGDYRESTSNENDGGYKGIVKGYGAGLADVKRFTHEQNKEAGVLAHGSTHKAFNVIAHEKLRNETLREENAHLKATISEIKALIKMKNQNIGVLEQRINFLECEKKLRDTDHGMIENGLELVDRLKAVYQEEVRMFCRKMERVRQENTVLKGNYDMLKKTVAELLKERRNTKDEY
ncbi:hypothetical protein THOM_0218 [Trachipleistophora hominis]|uniref:Uncharacterized protein n=1 Tax=Trachipleistophora hominis TaxID=72359 RepID=L7JZC8_TRAHO|nr:hypothetical protein THOM_0218 [Trachipleistophora hominis]